MEYESRDFFWSWFQFFILYILNSMKIPLFNEELSGDQISFLSDMSNSCRRSIVEMITKAASGHSGGSMSMIDYLTILYAFRLSQTGEKIIVSNGHTSPAVYAILAEMGYYDKDHVLNNFRRFGSVCEGHVNRHMPGVVYGTGPLGCGISAGVGFAHAEKLKGSKEKVFVTMGDGEMNEGQAFEAALYANKYKLDNLVVFVDYNKVQLMGSLEEVMPIDIKSIFESIGWAVLECDGHDFSGIWDTLSKSYSIKSKPILILGSTIMGKGVSFMEELGKDLGSSWHGKPTNEAQMEIALDEIQIPDTYQDELNEYKKLIKWYPNKPVFTKNLSRLDYINTGTPKLYEEGEIAPRTAYGNALLDLASKNKLLFGMSGDVGVSVRTDILQNGLPDQFIECGICEQNMVTVAGALSLSGLSVFVSAYGPFLTSRPKDQVRLNDINHTNVKMVATHSGLSVGEDGPTHQAIDDMGSFLGLYNTNIIEAVDANHMDRVVRYIASHYGNFYVRTGRHNMPIIKKEDGTPYYDADYKFVYGSPDIIREGDKITIIATGPMVAFAVDIADEMKAQVEVIAVTCLKDFDRATIINSLRKTGKFITVEDHNANNGLASQIGLMLSQAGIGFPSRNLSVKEYQLSGKYYQLYKAAGIDKDAIYKALNDLLS